ncbi:MAG: UpxY family transcription antiterminator [Nitrospirae bacterium]|nr:UpxY family transcription antiterminator [Nitrospirota bacterium]
MENINVIEPQWFALNVRSRHEFQVRERLTMKGIEAFLPTVERLRRWKDRKKMISFPLFPGYLFVHIPRRAQDILNVLKINGAVNLLSGAPGEPVPVPEEQIIPLIKAVKNNEPLDPYPYLKEGQRVRIIKGPMRGVEGLLVEKAERHMLVLSVDVLAQGVALRIYASDVERI